MKSILIIEDDQRIALALCVRLKAEGFATYVAADALCGLGLALRHRPDLILLDISLPAGNGFQLAEQFARFPETSETPVIFTTASKDPALRNKVIESGAAGLLRKPYDAEELLNVVREALEDYGLTDIVTYPCPQDNSHSLGQRRKVLIVEDDENVAKGLAIRMDSAGYETSVASDALSGVRQAMTTKPDLVILDVALPAGDGFAVAERLQAHLPNPTRIIFLTASSRPDFRKRAEQLGAVGFFEKPYESGALLDTIHQALC
jgi:DNA-binding response OmpR family regulator